MVKSGMNDEELGRLKRVDVRCVWPNEAQHFTPWLSRNLDRLSEELGIELELEAKEVSVGKLKADIVARIPRYGARVLIENQLEKTDLKHLGQILAYLAGLDAQIVVWVAKGFRRDHLRAIHWLNQNTGDPFSFFAIRVRAFQISDSPVAPTFRILAKPDEWNRRVKEIREGIDSHTLRRDFWNHCVGRWPIDLGLKKGLAESRFYRWIEEADLKVALYMRKDSVRVYVTGNSDEEDEDIFARIKPFRDDLKQALEGSSFLKGDNPRCRTMLDIDAKDRNNWNEMADWLYEQSRKYESVLRSGPSSTA